MNRLPTLLIAGLALHLTALPLCDAGNSRCCQPRKCAPCVTSSRCAPVCGGTVICSTGEFIPSDLNVQLTGEILELRKEVEALKLAAAEKDEALAASRKMASNQKKKVDQLTVKLGQETERAASAEQALAAAKADIAKSQAALAAVKQDLAKARQNNKQLQAKLAKSQQQLVSTQEQLAVAAKAKQEKPKQPRQPEKEAAQTPPAKVEKAPEKKDSPPSGDADEAKAPAAKEEAAPKA